MGVPLCFTASCRLSHHRPSFSALSQVARLVGLGGLSLVSSPTSGFPHSVCFLSALPQLSVGHFLARSECPWRLGGISFSFSVPLRPLMALALEEGVPLLLLPRAQQASLLLLGESALRLSAPLSSSGLPRFLRAAALHLGKALSTSGGGLPLSPQPAVCYTLCEGPGKG